MIKYVESNLGFSEKSMGAEARTNEKIREDEEWWQRIKRGRMIKPSSEVAFWGKQRDKGGIPFFERKGKQRWTSEYLMYQIQKMLMKCLRVGT